MWICSYCGLPYSEQYREARNKEVLAFVSDHVIGREREGEKRVCCVLWEAFNDFFDAMSDRNDIRLLDRLRDDLCEALPYGPEEVV